MTTPSTAQMLASLGWAEVKPDSHGNPWGIAVDIDTGAARLSSGPDGSFSCGSHGPRGRWPTFEAAVEAAYRHIRLGEPERPGPVAPDVAALIEAARIEGGREALIGVRDYAQSRLPYAVGSGTSGHEELDALKHLIGQALSKRGP